MFKKALESFVFGVDGRAGNEAVLLKLSAIVAVCYSLPMIGVMALLASGQNGFWGYSGIATVVVLAPALIGLMALYLWLEAKQKAKYLIAAGVVIVFASSIIVPLRIVAAPFIALLVALALKSLFSVGIRAAPIAMLAFILPGLGGDSNRGEAPDEVPAAIGLALLVLVVLFQPVGGDAKFITFLAALGSAVPLARFLFTQLGITGLNAIAGERLGASRACLPPMASDAGELEVPK